MRSTTDSKDWSWIEGEINLADWTTKWRKPTDIVIDSKQQRGTTFLQMNAAERQIQANCTLSELPEKTSVVVNGIKNKTKEYSK